jgi:hypothetical protein
MPVRIIFFITVVLFLQILLRSTDSFLKGQENSIATAAVCHGNPSFKTVSGKSGVMWNKKNLLISFSCNQDRIQLPMSHRGLLKFHPIAALYPGQD